MQIFLNRIVLLVSAIIYVVIAKIVFRIQTVIVNIN